MDDKISSEMTYIINYCDGCVSICRGHNQLTNELNFNFRTWRERHHYIENIIPMQYVEYFYFVYEFDERLYTSKPISNREFFRYLDFLLSEKANVKNIYEYTIQPVYPAPL